MGICQVYLLLFKILDLKCDYFINPCLGCIHVINYAAINVNIQN